MWFKLLLGAFAALVGYATYKGKAAEAATAAQTAGAMDPNYDSRGVVFAADAKFGGQRGPIGAQLIPRVVNPQSTLVVNGEHVYGPSAQISGTCGAPSGTRSGCSTPPSTPSLFSPFFWAADKVPTNPALQVPTNSIDANPYLDYPTARVSPVGAQPPVPVNHT
jgi:hypothetical protein